MMGTRLRRNWSLCSSANLRDASPRSFPRSDCRRIGYQLPWRGVFWSKWRAIANAFWLAWRLWGFEASQFSSFRTRPKGRCGSQRRVSFHSRFNLGSQQAALAVETVNSRRRLPNWQGDRQDRQLFPDGGGQESSHFFAKVRILGLAEQSATPNHTRPSTFVAGLILITSSCSVWAAT